MNPGPAPVSGAAVWQGVQLYARSHDAVARYLAGFQVAAADLEEAAVALAEWLDAAPTLALGLASIRPDQDDPAHHSLRAGLLAAALGREAGLGLEALADVFRAALVHEAGTALLPDALVCRAGALDPGERRALSRGSSLAVGRFLRKGPIDRHARLRIAALDGLHAPAAKVRRNERGEVEAFGELPRPPVVARLLAIGCSYDSLTGPRPYRNAYTPREALAISWTELAGRFDPSLLAAFQRLVGVGPVRVRTERPRETPTLVPATGTAPPLAPAVASVSIAGSGTVELALDDEDAVELADEAGEPLVVELAPLADEARALDPRDLAPPAGDDECVIFVDG